MIITHHLMDDVARQRGSTKPFFLLTNKKGSFAFFGTNGNASRFQGSYFSDSKGSTYKVIEDMKLAGTETQELRNNFFNIERIGGNCLERFFMNHTNTILYEALNFSGYLDLTLDCRKIYDYDDRGRIYKLSNEKGCLLIEYTKYRDESLGEVDYRVFLAIAGAKDYLKQDVWERHHYEFDRKRNSYPSDIYVYKILRIRLDSDSSLVFSCSDNRDTALDTAVHAMANFSFLKKSNDNYVRTLTKGSLNTSDKEITMAYKCSISAMDSFLVKNNNINGLYAGFPWFTQVWTRDEAISLKALMIDERFEDVKQVLFRQLGSILDDGRIPNRFPASMLGSADGVGWVFKRVFDFLEILRQKSKFDEFITTEELMFIKKKLRLSIERLLAVHTKDGLAANNALETWMDTGYKDDVRSGFRIELQALRLNMYKLMIYLCSITKNEPKYFTYSELEYVTHRKVKQSFWKKPVLLDGPDDSTIRPNIFLAYYVYPELLRRREWIACFDQALKSLWLDWGGLASIDKNHRYFVDEYTGEDNRSYHRGDSWFFINNLAAICMHRLDKKRYSGQIMKIVKASTEEILYRGIIGYHAEVSSAKEPRSEGCLAQAWSSATYIELIDEVF